MSNIKEFYKKLQEDETLQKELQEASNKASIEIAIEMAKKHGFELSKSDFEVQAGDLSDDELDMVAAGSMCVCFVGGGGSASTQYNNYHSFTCACVFGGGGEGCADMTDYSNRDFRCACPVQGGGDDSDMRW